MEKILHENDRSRQIVIARGTVKRDGRMYAIRVRRKKQ
jgi:hypothetical protein